jgi:hypothetical protein
MIPWDFGIINAIKKKIELSIFPPDPPEEFRKTPYLIFELKNITQGTNLRSRVEFVLTIVDNKEIRSESFNILRNINKIISKELTLCQRESAIGSAKIKIESIESNKNCLIVNLAAILQLKIASGENQ